MIRSDSDDRQCTIRGSNNVFHKGIPTMDDQQMPCWYYEREELLNSPSFVYDHIDHDKETQYRIDGARFLFNASNKLNLRYDTCATAIVFFHRFYMCHSFKAFPRYVTAACCLMLAGKVEETPKKVRDIVKIARMLLPESVFVEQFGSLDPREEVMAYERVLLKTIKFDLQVSHPYSFLLQFVKRIKGNKDKLKELVQMAWSFINDSLSTTLCLQWEPEVVACAVLYLATRMNKYTIEDWEGRQPGLRWWESFVEGMSTEVMEDICHKILDLYPADGGTPMHSTSIPSSSSQPAPPLRDRHHLFGAATSGSSTGSTRSTGGHRSWPANELPPPHAGVGSTGRSAHVPPNSGVTFRPANLPPKRLRHDADPAVASSASGYRSMPTATTAGGSRPGSQSSSLPPPPPPLPPFNSGLARK